MALGPGKYDDLCTSVRHAAYANAVLLVIIDGDRGSGFSVQAVNFDITARLPEMLRDFAKQIEESFPSA